MTAEEMLRYAMSLPVATTISGMDRWTCSTKISRSPGLPADVCFRDAGRWNSAALRQRGDGRFELYKVSLKYDNPEARRPHGFPIDSAERRCRRPAGTECIGPG